MALIVVGVVGTFTNTFLVLSMAVLRGYLSAGVLDCFAHSPVIFISVLVLKV
jgi:uncharacterized membrane protein